MEEWQLLVLDIVVLVRPLVEDCQLLVVNIGYEASVITI